MVIAISPARFRQGREENLFLPLRLVSIVKGMGGRTRWNMRFRCQSCRCRMRIKGMRRGCQERDRSSRVERGSLIVCGVGVISIEIGIVMGQNG